MNYLRPSAVTDSPVRWLGLTILLVVTAVATIAAVLTTDGNLVGAVAPVVAIGALWLLLVAPVRVSLLILMFLALALDKPGDTENLWRSPFNALGGLLIANLNQTINIPALKISLAVMLIGLLVLIRLRRRLWSDFPTEPGSIRPATPMMAALAVSALSAVALCGYGVSRGGDLQMCKIQLQVFLPLLAVAYLFAVSLRSVRDYRHIAIVIIAAACVKATMALWIRLTLPVRFGEGRGELPYATTHGDSMLFAGAAAILLAAFFERPDRRRARSLLVLPLLLAGIIANNRRLAWVELAVSFAVLLAMNPRSRPTRGLIRLTVYAAPVLLLYGAAGWSSGSKIFAPVRLVRSISDSNVDRSTLYRDGENYNLVYTFRQNPVLGTGFGHPFELPVVLDDISHGFKEWRYLPHNSILGLWAFTGGAGFMGLWSPLFVAVLLAARSYRSARSPDERVAASACITAVIVYSIHCWGDIGFTSPPGMFLLAPGLAIAGQLATLTRTWVAQEGIPAKLQSRHRYVEN